MTSEVVNKTYDSVTKKVTFPFKGNEPINAHVLIDVDGTEFTDCVEVAIRHFFYMVQPIEQNKINDYWDETDSPLKDKIKNFFESFGPQEANSEDPDIRKIWAEIVSRIPGLIYKKKTDESLFLNDVEIKAGWTNYLKAIAFLKNDKEAWDELCYACDILTEKYEIVPEVKQIVCNCFKKLAGKNLISCEWCEKSVLEGIRDMEDGTLDLLGLIRCTFTGTPKMIDFVMMDGHGFVRWTDL